MNKIVIRKRFLSVVAWAEPEPFSLFKENGQAQTPSLPAEPELLNSCWDWGGGDFETALEGAGHMGNKDIANFLLSKGARINIFCAAMLGGWMWSRQSSPLIPS